MKSMLLSLPLMFLLGGLLLAEKADTPDEGVLPLGADGKPLNLDFETGTLKDWTAEGEAFKGQPIKGDTVFPRRGDMKSRHQGQYWIGTYEVAGDKPQGTLTSAAFKVTHPWCSFLVGGGPHTTTCVELVRKDKDEVFSRTSGMEAENMERVAVDLHDLMGKEIFIRLVDRHSGHWGHINFDDFRFHAKKPNVPERKAPQALPPADTFKYAGLPPERSAQVMTVPEGFEVKLFAGEPDVQQPIAMCLDDRGRVWVAEAYCYPTRRPENEANDRILIFEDTKGEGKFDKRTVFMEGLNLVSGLEVGHGGVWIGASPYLMFVPVNDGEDKPAGPPKVLLDGFGYQDTHETLNSFSWGPDGWLYGCHGVFTHSRVGKPGIPDDQRIPINAGIWRYHPTKHVFEVFAHGTSNPWGFDFDDRGQAFCEACVVPHCFHIIQGGRYFRQAGAHFNPYTYADIATIADHLHWIGPNQWAGNDRSDSAGGGHAHCGTMIYLGGTWPKEYRNQMFMGNIHGRRINMDILKPRDSGYVASHGKDFLLANDAWARFINLRYGPDGNVYLIDWYDKQACHSRDPQIWDRTNGRIYKISYRGAKPVQVDLRKRSDLELVELQLNDNDWYVRHARRLLQERGGNKEVHAALEKIAFEHKDETRRLRALWALHVTNGLTEDRIMKGLADSGPFVRAWTIQLAVESGKPSSNLLKKLAEMARNDPSPVVRLYVASAAQRIPPQDRWDLAEGLLTHGEDAGDHNLPLMYWYAIEPLGETDAKRALEMSVRAKVPLLGYMARRLASAGTAESAALLIAELAREEGPAGQLAFLSGLQEGLKGRARVEMPPQWQEAYIKLSRSPNVEVRNRTLSVAAIFGDVRAFDELRKMLAAKNADPATRLEALTALVAAKDRKLVPVLHDLIGDATMRGPVLKALAAYDDPKSPDLILTEYARLNSAEKRDALATLASRSSYGKALLDAIAAKRVPAGEVSADVIRQLQNLKEPTIDQRIGEVWGIVRTTSAERRKLIDVTRKLLQSPGKSAPDVNLGRTVFTRTCQQCHTLFGVGGKVGPDITGANRASLDYLLERMFDPSAVIHKEYAATVIELKSGRFVTGIVREESKVALTLVTANETMTIPLADVAARTPSETSMMPDDVVKQLKEEELRSLVVYLQSPVQVPFLATSENVKDFFNGKDLAGWDGNSELWKVENGEIVGKSPGIKKNEFLRSHLMAADFRLTLKVKLVPNKENSGVQFRSESLPDGEVRGPQADIGLGWWGKLYEENARGVIWDKSGETHVKVDDWNEYEIVAKGSRIRTYINGKLCVDLDDPKGFERGIFALQIHAGGPMEVRFKDLKLALNPAFSER
jgi:putative membrane-bound dehydrogenase-like protein